MDKNLPHFHKVCALTSFTHSILSIIHSFLTPTQPPVVQGRRPGPSSRAVVQGRRPGPLSRAVVQGRRPGPTVHKLVPKIWYFLKIDEDVIYDKTSDIKYHLPLVGTIKVIW